MMQNRDMAQTETPICSALHHFMQQLLLQMMPTAPHAFRTFLKKSYNCQPEEEVWTDPENWSGKV
jgi:hypothetical protein